MTFGNHSLKKFRGLVERRERWSLTGRGALVIVMVLGIVASFLWLATYPFLAVTEPLDTDILVVEGWVHESAIRSAAEVFRKGSYREVLTTGGPMHGSGVYTNDYHTSASLGADRLRHAGIPRNLVFMVPSHAVDRDRTYQSALALRDWLKQNEPSVRSFNIATESAHARRTRLLFRKAFTADIQIGIIAIPNPDYDPDHWWRYSEGVRDVLGEAIAYVYARFFFYP